MGSEGGGEGGFMSSGEGKLRQKKKNSVISKAEVPIVPPAPHHTPLFKQLHKQSSKCSISERITLYSI